MLNLPAKKHPILLKKMGCWVGKKATVKKRVQYGRISWGKIMHKFKLNNI